MGHVASSNNLAKSTIINEPKQVNNPNSSNQANQINTQNNNKQTENVLNTKSQVNLNSTNNSSTTGEVNNPSGFNFNTKSTTVGGEVSLASLNRYCPTNNNSQRVDLSNSSSINRFLNTYTQVDQERRNTNATSQCGAASVVASAMMAGGKDGMNTLVETIKRRGNLNQEQQQRVNEIQNRINNNQMTRGDVEFLQGVVYQQLQSIDVARGYDTGEGVDIRSITEYCQTNCTPLRIPSIESMMRNSNITILGVDTNGSSNSLEHFVVANQGGSRDQIFDPWPRRGGQITNRDSDLENYYGSVATVRGNGGNFIEAKYPAR